MRVTAWAEDGRNNEREIGLRDAELHAEVEMTIDLIVAANEAQDRLSPSDVDRILGIRS